MRVLVFGASGMVGQGVLRECVLDPGVTEVVALVRARIGGLDGKVREVVHREFFD